MNLNLKSKKGYSLVEMLVSVAIIGVFIIFIGTLVMGAIDGDTSSISYGLNGMTETRCVNGYKVVIGQNGSPTQLLNEHGGGVPCN